MVGGMLCKSDKPSIIIIIIIIAFVVGGKGFELCVFVADWRHVLWSEWPFIIIIIIHSIIAITCAINL